MVIHAQSMQPNHFQIPITRIYSVDTTVVLFICCVGVYTVSTGFRYLQKTVKGVKICRGCTNRGQAVARMVPDGIKSIPLSCSTPIGLMAGSRHQWLDKKFSRHRWSVTLCGSNSNSFRSGPQLGSRVLVVRPSISRVHWTGTFFSFFKSNFSRSFLSIGVNKLDTNPRHDPRDSMYRCFT